MAVPRPIVSVQIAPQSDDHRERLQAAVGEIVRLDPLIEVRPQLDSQAILLAGQSESQLQAICARLRYEVHIDVAVTPPQVVYLETILKAADGEGKYIRQTGGSGNYGHVKIRIEPRGSGGGFAFISQIRGGVIPEQYFQPIEQGIREAARGGILSGCEVVDFQAILYDGSHHEADSNPMAFQIAAALAFKEAARKADPIVIEPIMTTFYTAMESRLAEMLAEIRSLRGRVEQVATAEGVTTVRALVPLREMLGYILGYEGPVARAMHFSHYALANWPPDSDAAIASVRKPRDPAPNPRRGEVDPEFDWT